MKTTAKLQIRPLGILETGISANAKCPSFNYFNGEDFANGKKKKIRE